MEEEMMRITGMKGLMDGCAVNEYIVAFIGYQNLHALIIVDEISQEDAKDLIYGLLAVDYIIFSCLSYRVTSVSEVIFLLQIPAYVYVSSTQMQSI
jgi:hypothetical protein